MQRNKTQIFFSHFLVVFVLLCFVGMTGYSELLHDHDHDFSESRDGCSPCNWTKSHKVDNNEKTYIAHSFSFSDTFFQLSFLKSEDLLSDFYIRGPPLVS
ncbi:hypothetical protein M1N16_08165 [Nitrospinaceae bacterium]|nr:hypothetical protein [Nitrospinaceae bacterium]